MKLRIHGEVFDLPPPVPAADEIVIATARYVVVPLPRPAAAERTVSLLNLRKVLFFIFREGVPMTLAKIRAIMAKRALTEGRALVIAIGRDAATGQSVLALGGQDCPDAEQLCFARSLARMSDTGDPDDDDVTALLAFCAANPDIAAALRDGSRYSGRQAAVTMATALGGRPASAGLGRGACPVVGARRRFRR